MIDIDNDRFALTYDTRTKAKFLYWMGWRVSSIAKYLGENDKTVHSWKDRDEWEKDAPEGIAAQALEARLCTLYLLDKRRLETLKKLTYLSVRKIDIHVEKSILVMKAMSLT